MYVIKLHPNKGVPLPGYVKSTYRYTNDISDAYPCLSDGEAERVVDRWNKFIKEDSFGYQIRFTHAEAVRARIVEL